MDNQIEVSGVPARRGPARAQRRVTERGEEDYWTEVARCRARLLRQAMILTRERAAAEDLVHDTIERGLHSPEKFRHGTNVGAWLGTILRNRFVDTYRRSRVRVDAKMLASDEAVHEEVGPIDVFTVDDVMAVLERLRPRSQEMFSWVYLQRLSYREVAETARIPLSTVGTRLFRVRGEVRRALLEEFNRRMIVARPAST